MADQIEPMEVAIPATPPFGKLSIVEMIAVSSALTVVLGFSFFIGFCFQLDWRLFQFMTPSDYVTIASSYVFAIPLSFFAYSRLSYSDFDRDKSVTKELIKWLRTDFGPLTKQEAENHMMGTRFARWLLVLPIIPPILFIGFAFSPRCNFLPPHMFIFALLVSSLPYSIWTCIQSMAIERAALERRAIGLKGLVMISFMTILAYGLFQGGSIADSKSNNVVIHAADGATLDGVFIYRFAAGVALRQPGHSSITFFPDAKIARLDLGT